MKKLTHYLKCTFVLCFVLFLYAPAKSQSGCVASSQYPASPVSVSNYDNWVTISTCNYTGDYAILTNISVGENYVIDIDGFTGYIVISNDADNTSVEAEGANPITFTPTILDDYYIHFFNDASCGATVGTCINTSLQCASCPPEPASCGIGVNQTTDPLQICDGESGTITLDGTEYSPDGYYYVFFSNNNTAGTGGPPEGFYNWQVTSFPLTFDNGLNGVLSNLSHPPFSGTWEYSIHAYEGGLLCSSITGYIVEFLPETDPACIPECSVGVNLTADPLEICENTSGTITLDGSEHSPYGSFNVFFTRNSTTGTGGPSTGAYNYWVTEFPVTFDNDLNGELSSNGHPPMEGEWEYTISAYDGVTCSSSPFYDVNFLPSTESACCSVGMNLTANPLEICGASSDYITLDGSENSPYGQFNILFSRTGTTGTGGPSSGYYGLWMDNFPFEFNNDLNGVLSSNGHPVMEGEWEYTIRTYTVSGTFCTEGEPYIVNFTPNSPSCCHAGNVTSMSPIEICEGNTGTISLDGTENSPNGNFELQFFNSNPIGGGGPTSGYISLPITTFPYTFDNDLNGYLSSNGYDPLVGNWIYTVAAIDELGWVCDETPSYDIHFYPDYDIACNSIFCGDPYYDIYVDHTATGTEDGSSWANAFTDLQSALAVGAYSNIYIARGTYKPTTGTNRGASFVIPEGAALYGGYPNGGGGQDINANPTTLSGEIDNVSGFEGNSYHVVKIQNVFCVSLNGLTIKHGSADDPNSFGRARGGGLYVVGSDIILNQVKVRWNNAIYGGGMFATLSPKVEIHHSDFKNNVAEYGAALYHSNETKMYVYQTKIYDNNSLTRCAIEVNNSEYTRLENVLIANNESRNANAIGMIATNRDQRMDVYNSTILGESLNKNLVTMQIGFGDQLDANFYNSIIAHQDLSFNKSIVAFNNNILNLTTRNCYIQGSSIIGSAMDNLYSDTAGDLFLNPDYSLSECSPAVGAGQNIYTYSELDIDNNPRIYNAFVDIGAFEVQEDCVLVREANNEMKKEPEATIEISIYPNPTQGQVYVKTALENIHVNIFDMLGKKIISTQERELDISNLERGFYIFNVISENGLLHSEKIIKN